MAKSCMVNREIKRIRLVSKFSTKRAELKAVKYNFIQFFLPGFLLDGQPIVDLNCIFKTISSQNTFIFTF